MNTLLNQIPNLGFNFLVVSFLIGLVAAYFLGPAPEGNEEEKKEGGSSAGCNCNCNCGGK